MKPEEIWTQLYENGISIGLDLFNPFQKHLFYFIDFVYSVEMEGISGFLYNKSPSIYGENNYQPYINSLCFFNLQNLSILIREFNNKCQNTFKFQEKELAAMSIDEFYQKFELLEIKKEIECLVKKVLKEQINDTMIWIDKNEVELIK